jgi:hypothetical protein
MEEIMKKPVPKTIQCSHMGYVLINNAGDLLRSGRTDATGERVVAFALDKNSAKTHLEPGYRIVKAKIDSTVTLLGRRRI